MDLRLVLICCLVPAWAGAQVSAVPNPEPQPGPGRHEGPPEFHSAEGPGFKRPFGGQDKPRPEPFLMAGDDRFEKMLELALVPEDEVQSKLAEWAQRQGMEEQGRERFARLAQGFRQRIHHQALQEAERLGLQLREEDKQRFIGTYWKERAAIERRLREETRQKWEAEMNPLRERLRREFGGG